MNLIKRELMKADVSNLWITLNRDVIYLFQHDHEIHSHDLVLGTDLVWLVKQTGLAELYKTIATKLLGFKMLQRLTEGAIVEVGHC